MPAGSLRAHGTLMLAWILSKAKPTQRQPRPQFRESMGRVEVQAWGWAGAQTAQEGRRAGRAGRDLGQECEAGGSWRDPIRLCHAAQGLEVWACWLGGRRPPAAGTGPGNLTDGLSSGEESSPSSNWNPSPVGRAAAWAAQAQQNRSGNCLPHSLTLHHPFPHHTHSCCFLL